MASSLGAKIRCGIWFDWQDQTDDGVLVFQDRGEVALLGPQVQLDDGDMDGQANQVWHTRPGGRRLAAGANETFDLTALTFQMLGVTATLPAFVEIRAICVVLESSGQGVYIEVGGAASNEFVGPFVAAGDKIKVHAGSPFLVANIFDGWTVSGSAKNIKINNPSGVDVSYEMCILGTTGSSTSSSS